MYLPLWGLRSAVSVLLLSAAAVSLCFAQENSRRVIPNSNYGFVTRGKDLGSVPSSNQITVYLWLNLHNADGLRQLVEQQYDASSGNYRNWLTPEQFDSTYAPTAEDVATVKQFLTAHNLQVTSVGESNMYLKAQGSVADIQRAFSVQLHNFNVRGNVYHANTTSPLIEGPAGLTVSRVGLTDYRMQSNVVHAANPQTGKALSAVRVSSVSPRNSGSAPQCLQSLERVVFPTQGGGPTATYSGYTYDPSGCGYSPSNLQTAYNLTGLYRSGLNGASQSVAIVDAYGSPTISSDASFYASYYGMGPLNLHVYNACPAPDEDIPGCPAPLQEGWGLETTLDVESAHTVAPGARLNLIYGYSDSFDDLAAAILFALNHHLGNSISNSWSAPESELGGSPYTAFDDLLLGAIAQGVSVNFATGDYGDWSTVEGFADASYPDTSPYATGVGGTSLFLNPNGSMAFQTGWGNSFTALANPPSAGGSPIVPPDSSLADGWGFYAGAGGGTSAVYSKPSFQRSLRGSYRKMPDVSYLADPYTGIDLICTGSSCFGLDSSLYLDVLGGTSLATPMFSALWAIANQASGWPLGQAARSLYNLPNNAIYDVTPFSSPFNVSGYIVNNRQVTYYNYFNLIGPETPQPFISALLQIGNATEVGPTVDISFGTDTSLFTAPGWDDVTGVGTPNGQAFVDAVAGHR